MKKLVYSFWSAPLKELWKNHPEISTYDEFLNLTIRSLYLSILYAKKRGFKIELFTDHNSLHLFKDLPIDHLNAELSFLSYKSTYIEGKFYALSKQTEPFVYLDWDIFFLKEDVADQIKNFKEDVLIQSFDNVSNNYGDSINHENVLKMQHHADFSSFLVDNFYKNSNIYPNTSIIGFNNLDIKDIYVASFLKCLTIVRNDNLANFSKVINHYLFYSVLDKSKSSCYVLLNNNLSIQQDAEKIGYTHLIGESKYSNQNQLKISERLKKEFPEYLKLVQTEPLKNKIKISLCTVVMNRFDHTIHTLKKNIEIVSAYKGAINLNVLDYNSSDGLEEYLFNQDWFVNALKNKILFFYKNYTAKYYHRTLPKNIIHFLSKGEYLINIDADNFISKVYLNYCLELTKTNQNFFLRPSLINVTGSFGRIMIHKDDFKKIGGYNLNIKNYGFEDCEITMRLKNKGVRQLTTPNRMRLKCIGHSDKLRVVHEEQEIFKNGKNRNPWLSNHYNKQLDFSKETDKNEYHIEIYRFDSESDILKIDTSCLPN